MIRRPREVGSVGARSLRGGKNKYSAKTLNGNWVESQYDPSFADVDVDSPNCDDRYMTIQQLAFREGARQKAEAEFGAALEPKRIGSKNIVSYNKEKFPSDEWESVTQSAHRGPNTKVCMCLWAVQHRRSRPLAARFVALPRLLTSSCFSLHPPPPHPTPR